MMPGLPIRHIEEVVNVPMYKTNVKCRPSGVFKGNLVVTMRPYPAGDVGKAAEITGR